MRFWYIRGNNALRRQSTARNGLPVKTRKVRRSSRGDDVISSSCFCPFVERGGKGIEKKESETSCTRVCARKGTCQTYVCTCGKVRQGKGNYCRGGRLKTGPGRRKMRLVMDVSLRDSILLNEQSPEEEATGSKVTNKQGMWWRLAQLAGRWEVNKKREG